MNIDEKVISCIFNELLVEDANLYEGNIEKIDVNNGGLTHFILN